MKIQIMQKTNTLNLNLNENKINLSFFLYRVKNLFTEKQL